MFNRIAYNRNSFNLTALLAHVWSGTASGNSGARAGIAVTRRMTGTAAAKSQTHAAMIRIRTLSGEAEAESGAQGLQIRTRRFTGAAGGESGASGTGLLSFGTEIMELAQISMQPGDELIIDTDKMTVTLNGRNVVDKVTDDSIFFALDIGSHVTFEGGSAADVKILWKDRWL